MLKLPLVRKLPRGIILALSALYAAPCIYIGIARVVSGVSTGSVVSLTSGVAFLCGWAIVPMLMCRYRLTIADKHIEVIAMRTTRICFNDVREVRVKGEAGICTVQLIADGKKVRILGPGALPDREAIIQTIAEQLRPYSSIRFTGDAETIQVLFGKSILT